MSTRPQSAGSIAAVDRSLAGDPATDEFVGRHIGPSDDQVQLMLAAIGAGSLDELIEQTVPAAIAEIGLALGQPRTEVDVLAELRKISELNRPRISMIGMGYTNTITPAVITRNVLENPAWYTAYTPYQPEISQGRLEALVNFQTMVTELTGLDIANASLLDEATAAAEAMTMALRLGTKDSNRFFVHHDTHPQIISVLMTRAEPVGIELVVGEISALEQGTWFGGLFSSPTSTGALVDWTAAIRTLKASGGLAIVTTDLLACTLMVPPGEMGADIAVGSAQRFGVPLGFGGPHAAFIAVRADAARAIPGRLVGVSTDTEGRPALRLALQTREQHIRRERATSNICTAQVLLANIAGFYAVWHGPEGLRQIAERVHHHCSGFAEAMLARGHRLRSSTWFDTVVVEGIDAEAVIQGAQEAGVDLRLVDDQSVGLTFDERSSLELNHRVIAVFDQVTGRVPERSEESSGGIPSALQRTSPYLTQAVFHRYRSEHEMLRYLRRLSDRDLALDRTMIPLGSCTMKLNATSEMIPVTWPLFAEVHPFAPADTTLGYQRIIADLEHWLTEITGYSAVSLQPNAGSQGEFAGLLAIRAYHRDRGDSQRTVCLIPSSAHGTNAASAVMAGFEVKVIGCDSNGDVDLEELRTQIAAVGDRLGAIMVTYPSTHGVFETGIVELCDLIHEAGGQVYVDGANLNALVGLARPGHFGADVSHLNLHKTFCIPHGGGGPGVGPVAVRAHLAPYLPGHPLGVSPVGPVAAAPFGSAGILPIPWVYLSLMGASGLVEATKVAILSANYMATRLDHAFPVLYRGAGGRVAHECIIDLRPITKRTGVTVDDVAKRLVDYGFHAPTMSFPVSGTLMIEPTESEDLREIDRFCDAMLAIAAEIEMVASGQWPLEHSPLRMAPHTAMSLVEDWDRPYSREVAVFPVAALRSSKYFPPVSRIDAAYGDRNLMCSCEPLEAYADQ
jgi:glycine dehydrogenase